MTETVALSVEQFQLLVLTACLLVFSAGVIVGKR
jgi:hypothetical protein